MSDRPQSPRPQDLTFAGRILLVMANRVSIELAAFSGWMVLGFAAVLGLLVANLDKVSGFVAPEALGLAIKLFLLALVLNVIQRYMAAIVVSSVAVGKELESMPTHPGMEIRTLLAELESATFWPTRLLVRWTNQKILDGDFAFSGRLNARLAQAQGWLVFAQLIAVVTSTLVIANALHN